MRSDLLKAIAGAREATNAIILTHNIDFVFLQTVVLAAFRRCGHPAITVFADAQCAAESYAHQAPVLDALGVRYRVVPVAMPQGSRFHPKAVLLSGEKEATLFVGSGNLTFGGWRENAEVWMRFDATVDGAGVFGEFKEYLQGILERVPLSDAIGEELGEAFDTATRGWMSEGQESTTSVLLGRTGDGAPLLERFQGVKGAGPLDELVVCSPYFDAEGAALRALIEQTGAARATVLCQPSGSTLTRKAFSASGERAKLQQVTFEHQSTDGTARAAFIHAKFYGLLRGDEALVIAGSANCSRAALIAKGSTGNAELMAVRRMPATEFEASFVGELRRVPAAAVLAEAAPDADDPPVVATLRVLAARFESGSLLVAFVPARTDVRSCVVDGVTVRFTRVEPGILGAACTVEPRSVRLEGVLDGASVLSAPAWVDHEKHLRASARGRSLSDSIRARMQPGAWNAAAWADVMDVFCKHLTYMPTRGVGRTVGTAKGVNDSGEGAFSFADVFSDSYQAPSLGGLGPLFVKVEGGKERSLQQLLLRWFGVGGEEEEDASAEAEVEDEGDAEGDRPEALPAAPKPRITSPPLTEADKRRIQRVLQQVEEAMTNEQFLAERRPDLLAADLKVAAVLLRTGLREGWLGPSEFFQTTHRIWTSLFFSGSPDTSRGWLEYRLHHAEDATAFIAAVRSPELAAAMLGWAFAVVPQEASPTWARFQLGVALAVARLPWLWDAGDETAVARELEVLLAHTEVREDGSAARLSEAWERMLRRGHALLRLENAAKAVPLAEVRARIRSANLLAGDLLWQGSAGYCVVTKATARTGTQKVPVLQLQKLSELSHFVASFTLPIVALVEEAVLPPSPEFGTAPRRVLREFLDELRSGFGVVSATSDSESEAGSVMRSGKQQLKASKVTPPAA